jgi:hypothetical protein
MSPADAEMVGIDILDAAELAEICDYLGEWITHAPTEVTDSLARHGASPAAPQLVLDALARFAELLVRLVPSVSPVHVSTTAPLGPGEALGLAELLIELAINGWPTDEGHVEALEHDLRRWALRLSHIPGVVP